MNPNVKATASYLPGTTSWTMVVFEAVDVPAGTKVQPVQQPALVGEVSSTVISTAYDVWRDGKDLPLSDAFTFAAGYAAAVRDAQIPAAKKGNVQ